MKWSKVVVAIALAILLTQLFSESLPYQVDKFAILTVALPSAGIPLPLQLVIAYGWQIEVAKECSGYPWWTLGCFGVTFVTERGKIEEVKKLITQVCHRADWDPLVARHARSLSSQQIRNWMREPMEWLRWQARVEAMKGDPSTLDPEHPSRVSLDDLSEAVERLSQFDLLLLTYDFESRSWSFTAPSPSPPSRLRLGFSRRIKLPSSQRAHWLWWTVSAEDPAVMMTIGELLGGGTGATWFQLLRGDQPIAYHAIAQAQLTQAGSELTLYAATVPDDLPTARLRAQRLLLELGKGRINGEEFERAKKLAELRLAQMESDPIGLSRTKAIWFLAGHSLDEWEALPTKIRSLSLRKLVSSVRSLPPAVEITAVP